MDAKRYKTQYWKPKPYKSKTGLRVKISELLNHIHYSGNDYDDYKFFSNNCQHFAHQMLDILLQYNKRQEDRKLKDKSQIKIVFINKQT